MKYLLDPFLKRPVTAGLLVMLSITMCWLGFVLIHIDLPPDIPGRPRQYQGPRTFAPLHAWGWAFLTTGIIKFLRIPALDRRWVSLFLHLPSLIVVMAWAISFVFGPMSTAQPIYLLFAALVALNPMLTQVIEWSIRYNGFIVIPKPGGRHALEDYPETHFSREARKLYATDSEEVPSQPTTKSEGTGHYGN